MGKRTTSSTYSQDRGDLSRQCMLPTPLCWVGRSSQDSPHVMPGDPSLTLTLAYAAGNALVFAEYTLEAVRPDLLDSPSTSFLTRVQLSDICGAAPRPTCRSRSPLTESAWDLRDPHSLIVIRSGSLQRLICWLMASRARTTLRAGTKSGNAPGVVPPSCVPGSITNVRCPFWYQAPI